jgi:hypothetical protein
VAARQEANENAIYDVLLPDNDLSYLFADTIQL